MQRWGTRHVQFVTALYEEIEETTSKTKPARMMTLHPGGKKGANIERDKYEGMRRALLRVIPRGKEGVAFQQLPKLTNAHLDKAVFGPKVSINWYVVTVKQDLEARGLVEQIPGKRTQHLRRAAGGAR